MSLELEEYLKKVKFAKQLKNLNKKLKNKKIVIYGSGLLFKTVKDNYDLSGLNIIGISDQKIMEENEGSDILGYKAIPLNKIADYAPDYVLVATLKFMGILNNFETSVLKGSKTKILPFVDKPFSELLKEIWGC